MWTNTYLEYNYENYTNTFKFQAYDRQIVGSVN